MTTQDKTNKKKEGKMEQLILFTLRQELLKTCLRLQQKHIQLKEQVNAVKLRLFRAATRIPTVSTTHGQRLMPVKTVIKGKTSKGRRLICSVCKFNFANTLS
jgi:hypothetical protein